MKPLALPVSAFAAAMVCALFSFALAACGGEIKTLSSAPITAPVTDPGDDPNTDPGGNPDPDPDPDPVPILAPVDSQIQAVPQQGPHGNTANKARENLAGHLARGSITQSSRIDKGEVLDKVSIVRAANGGLSLSGGKFVITNNAADGNGWLWQDGAFTDGVGTLYYSGRGIYDGHYVSEQESLGWAGSVASGYALGLWRRGNDFGIFADATSPAPPAAGNAVYAGDFGGYAYPSDSADAKHGIPAGADYDDYVDYERGDIFINAAWSDNGPTISATIRRASGLALSFSDVMWDGDTNTFAGTVGGCVELNAQAKCRADNDGGFSFAWGGQFVRNKNGNPTVVIGTWAYAGFLDGFDKNADGVSYDGVGFFEAGYLGDVFNAYMGNCDIQETIYPGQRCHFVASDVTLTFNVMAGRACVGSVCAGDDGKFESNGLAAVRSPYGFWEITARPRSCGVGQQLELGDRCFLYGYERWGDLNIYINSTNGSAYINSNAYKDVMESRTFHATRDGDTWTIHNIIPIADAKALDAFPSLASVWNHEAGGNGATLFDSAPHSLRAQAAAAAGNAARPRGKDILFEIPLAVGDDLFVTGVWQDGGMFGVYAEAPAPDASSIPMPASGSAVYEGQTAAYVHAVYLDEPDSPIDGGDVFQSGTHWDKNIRLTVTFGDAPSLSGELRMAHAPTFLMHGGEWDAASRRFTKGNLECKNSCGGNKGVWSGQFINIASGSGKPGAFAGTFGISDFTLEGGYLSYDIAGVFTAAAEH